MSASGLSSKEIAMFEKQKPRNINDNQRAERQFDVLTFVLAGLLAAIVFVAVGYGIFISSRVASVIPLPKNGSETAFRATTTQRGTAARSGTNGLSAPEVSSRRGNLQNP
jgi:hypothetical protein